MTATERFEPLIDTVEAAGLLHTTVCAPIMEHTEQSQKTVQADSLLLRLLHVFDDLVKLHLNQRVSALFQPVERQLTISEDHFAVGGINLERVHETPDGDSLFLGHEAYGTSHNDANPPGCGILGGERSYSLSALIQCLMYRKYKTSTMYRMRAKSSV